MRFYEKWYRIIRMNFSSVFQTFLDDFQDNSVKSVCYISLPNSSIDSLPRKVIDEFTIIDLENDFSPFKPFLNIISSFSPSEELVSEKSYILQKNTFLSYFKYGTVEERYDLISLEETFYEKSRYIKTIIDLLVALGKKPLEKKQKNFFILNAQSLCDSAIEILDSLGQVDLNFKFIFCFDAQKIGNASPSILSFFDKITSQDNIFDFTAKNIQSLHAHEKKNENPMLYNFDFLYKSLKNARTFLSLEQGRILADWIETNKNSLYFFGTQKRALYLEMGLVYFYSKLYDKAELFLHNVLDIQYEDERNLAVSIFLANIYRYENSYDVALKHIRHVLQLCQNQKDSLLYALALMTEYSISSQLDNVSYEKYTTTISTLKKCGLINSYISTMLVIPWSFLYDNALRDSIHKNIINGYKLANEIGNKFALSTICHWCGILASQEGKTEDAFGWYDECNKIRTEIGDMNSIIKIRNGLSYEALIRSRYKQSYDFINSFISNLPQMDDYAEIIITLNNIAQALFYSRHFDKASVLFQKILYFMYIFNLQESSCNSFMPNYNDILIYKTFIDVHDGNIILAKINCHNIINNGRTISHDGKIILSVIDALLFLKEGNLKESTEIFEKCITDFLSTGSGLEHRLVFMEYEYAIMLDSAGHQKESEKYFKNGFNRAKEKNLEYFTKNKPSITYSDYIYGVQDFAPLNIDLIYMQEKTEKDRILNQLHGKLKSYQFLNRIMTYGLDGSNIQEFGRNVLSAIFDYTTADAAFIAKKQNGSWTLIHSIQRIEQNVPDTEIWDSLFVEENHFETTMIAFDEKNNFYYSNISRFEFIGGIIIFPGKSIKLLPDTINTLNIALSTIQAQFVMFSQNEHLLYISSTDFLSKLHNHRALQDYLDKESARLKSEAEKSMEVQKITIVFMDLDNFKFYNDTYGHEAGDLFISCFASSLKKLALKEYFFSRFGGDEFVCILPNSDYDDAKRLTNALYATLKTEQHFIPRLEKFLEKKLNIGKEHFLSFSAGVCTNLDTEEFCDLNLTMSLADKSLYYSKEHGRKRVSYWNDIKNEIPSDDGKTRKSKYLGVEEN